MTPPAKLLKGSVFFKRGKAIPAVHPERPMSMSRLEPDWLVSLAPWALAGRDGLALAAAALARHGFVVILVPRRRGDGALPPATAAETAASAAHRDPAGFRLRRQLARGVAALAGGLPPEGLAIAADPRGKPVFTAPGLDLHLSFSARDGVSVVGLGRAPIGVDLEGEIAAGAIPWNILRLDEVLAIRGLPLSEQPHGFLRLWSQKEAFLKASGEVLAIPPEDIRIVDAGAIELRDRGTEVEGGAAGWRPARACLHLYEGGGGGDDPGASEGAAARYVIALALLSERPR